MNRLFMGTLCAATAFCALPATADVIYDNGDPIDDSSFFSDFDFPQQIADDFVLQSGATLLTDVHWWGVYTPVETPGTDSFTIRIFADDGGGPDVSPIYEFTGIDSGRTATGDEADSFDLYAYWADITPIALSANTTYWISIVNDTTTDSDDQWAWATSASAGGNVSFRDNDSQAWITTSDYYEQAFYLTGSSIVPEPASMTLLVLGLSGLAYRRRKKN